MHAPPLLERDTLLALASDAQRQAAGRREGQILLVVGEAGIGKTSFIAALRARAQDEGLRLLESACEPLGVPRPLGPLRDLARSGLPRLQPLLDREAPLAEVFGALLGEFEQPRPAGLLVVEDLHWADGATLDLLKLLARRITPLPLLLVLSFRDDELDDAHPLHGLLGSLPPARTLRLQLPPLSASAVATLCAAAGRSDAADLHAVTGGNPFFITELLASALPDAHQGVPSTVREAVLARVHGLAPGPREALQRLSLLPGGCEPALAAALLPAGLAPADLDSCVERGLLRLEAGRLRFRHELARRAVADRLPPMQRRGGHAAILAALAAPPPGIAPAAAALLAHHAEAAGDAPALLIHAQQAAQQAAAAGAHREAAQLLKAVLPHAAQLPAERQAELLENWSYEAGLAQGIDAEVLAARQRAVALWRQLGRGDKVGLNLRWLSRLHWYLGETSLAEQYAAQAVAALEAVDAPLERAWAYSTRAQLGLLQERPDDALHWGQRAIQLALRIARPEVQAHALNIVGTAGLQTGHADAIPQLQRSLALALAGGFHEQAARSYATLAGHAVMSKDFAAAERWLDEAIAFGERYDLDGRLAYLLGWQAQLRFEQGRYAEAERLAEELLARPRLHALARLPAQSLRARLLVRQGDAQATEALRSALAVAQGSSEALRVLPLRLAEVELAWLGGDLARARAALQSLPPAIAMTPHPWVAGEIAVWQQRCSGEPPPARLQAAEPWALELQGQAEAAAQAWRRLGAPYEAALGLLAGARAPAAPPPSASALAEAAAGLAELGAQRALAALRELARARGIALPGRPNGPRAAARAHPHGLTAREQQVLALMAEGAGNARIGAQLALAPRTVEHHVSAVLAKLGVRGRAEAVALAWRERLLGDA